MIILQKFNRLIITSIVFVSTLLYAQSEKEHIAVIELKGEISASESVTLTGKVINEILKTGEYIILERSQMDDILKEQGFQQTGCTSAECAVEIGQLLGVKKTVFGNIGKVGKLYSISLKIVNVQTGEIVKSSFIEFKGTLEDVLTKGIIKAVNDLLEPVSKDDSSTLKQDKKIKVKRHPVQTAFAIASATAAVGMGAVSAYYWVEKADYHDKYLALHAGQQDLMDSYHEQENTAYTRAAVFTCISGALIPTSIVLFIIRPKRKEKSKVSVNTFITPELKAVNVTVNF